MTAIEIGILAGIPIFAALLIFVIYLSDDRPWTRIYYNYKYPECTQNFRVGPIRKPHKLTTRQIQGTEWFDINLITGNASKATIQDYSEVFQQHLDTTEWSKLTYIVAHIPSIHIRMPIKELTPQKMKELNDIIQQVNNIYFINLQEEREKAQAL